MICRTAALALGLLFTGQSVFGFIPSSQQSTGTQLLSSAQDEGDSRRSFFSKTAGMAAVGLGCPFLPLDAANAVTGAGKVNAKLKGYEK